MKMIINLTNCELEDFIWDIGCDYLGDYVYENETALDEILNFMDEHFCDGIEKPRFCYLLECLNDNVEYNVEYSDGRAEDINIHEILEEAKIYTETNSTWQIED